MRLTLDFRLGVSLPLDASPLLPERMLPLSESELAHLSLQAGRETLPLSEVCRLDRAAGEADEIRLAGAAAHLHRVGCRMNGGRIVVEGSLGPLGGAEMAGGELLVLGDAGSGTGAGMSGGLIQIQGNAGDHTGGALAGSRHGMAGGLILVEDCAGRFTGERMRRGLVFVRGDTGEFTGWEMRAGTILVGGTLGPNAGLHSRRGSIVASRSPVLPAGYQPACQDDFTWLRLVLARLRELGVDPPAGWPGGLFTRCHGYQPGIGKGELLLYDSPE